MKDLIKVRDLELDCIREYFSKTIENRWEDFDEEWKADFPNDKPLYYSEYGDLDGDGLPNWFEMYWFGKFPFLETATAADPAADPDQDGKQRRDGHA